LTELTYGHIIDELKMVGRPILLYDLYLRLRRRLKSKFNYNTYIKRIRDLEKGVKVRDLKGWKKLKIKIMKVSRFNFVYLPDWQFQLATNSSRKSLLCDLCHGEIEGKFYLLCEECFFAFKDSELNTL